MKTNIRNISVTIVTTVIIASLLSTAAFANSASYNDASNFTIENGVLTHYSGVGYGLEVVIPDGVKEIGSMAFREHDGVVSVTIPDSVETIGTSAFWRCTSLTDVYIGSGVTDIANGPWEHSPSFSNCSSLQSFHVSADNKVFSDIDGVLIQNGKWLLKFPEGRAGDYTVPSNITRILPHAFMWSNRLTNVTIPGTIKVIESRGFSETRSMQTVTIEDGVTNIDRQAFLFCSAKDIIVPPSVTKITEGAIRNSFDNLIVYGVAGSTIESYCKQNDITFSTGSPSDTITAPNLNTASEWAHDSISSAINKRFVPVAIQDNYTSVITRQEFATLAVKFVEYKTGKQYILLLDDMRSELKREAFTDNATGLVFRTDIFTDTDNGYITAAYALGITNGTSDTTFSPDATITREQAATMLMNLCNVLDIGTSGNVADFSDAGQISSWAMEGVNFCYANGIMTGTSTNSANPMFNPKDIYTRQESIITFDRIH